MAALNPGAAPPTQQERMFYNINWTKEIDKKIISILVSQKAEGHFVVGAANTGSIFLASNEINRLFGTNFDLKYCEGILRKLHRCYKVFSDILSFSGVDYNPSDHTIECEEEVWKFILQNSPFGKAYERECEHDFDDLKTLFYKEREAVEPYTTIEEVMLEYQLELQEAAPLEEVPVVEDHYC